MGHRFSKRVFGDDDLGHAAAARDDSLLAIHFQGREQVNRILCELLDAKWATCPDREEEA